MCALYMAVKHRQLQYICKGTVQHTWACKIPTCGCFHLAILPLPGHFSPPNASTLTHEVPPSTSSERTRSPSKVDRDGVICGCTDRQTDTLTLHIQEYQNVWCIPRPVNEQIMICIMYRHMYYSSYKEAPLLSRETFCKLWFNQSSIKTLSPLQNQSPSI